jgi:hypothetical protein
MQSVVITHPEQNVGESGEPVTRFLGEIGATEERSLIVVGQEHRQRPAAGSLRQHLLRDLIDAVDVRSLFSIHLDVDKAFVQDARDPVVLERFVGHNVAPMTGGVTDTEVDWLLLTASTLERLVTPWVPLHWIMGVLKQVRTRL